MKKLLVMFAIAGSLVACNNSSETTTTTDSPKVEVVTPVVPATPDTTVHVNIDTTKHVTDTTHK